MRVQKVVNEYTKQGWCRAESLQELQASGRSVSLEKELEDDPYIQSVKQAFSSPTISATDIILPPFDDGKDRYERN